jgi:hypothetical protein
MSWSRRQLRMSDPNVFLLFPLLARPHRHTRILRILPVDPSNSFAYVSGLTPRAASRSSSLHSRLNREIRPLKRASDYQSAGGGKSLPTFRSHRRCLSHARYGAAGTDRALTTRISVTQRTSRGPNNNKILCEVAGSQHLISGYGKL